MTKCMLCSNPKVVRDLCAFHFAQFYNWAVVNIEEFSSLRKRGSQIPADAETWSIGLWLMAILPEELIAKLRQSTSSSNHISDNQ